MGGGRLGSILIKLNLCTEAQMCGALEEQMGVEVVELNELVPERRVIDLLPRELVRKYEAIPVRMVDDALYVAMTT